jgi:hypothetical protein
MDDRDVRPPSLLLNRSGTITEFSLLYDAVITCFFDSGTIAPVISANGSASNRGKKVLLKPFKSTKKTKATGNKKTKKAAAVTKKAAAVVTKKTSANKY